MPYFICIVLVLFLWSSLIQWSIKTSGLLWSECLPPAKYWLKLNCIVKVEVGPLSPWGLHSCGWGECYLKKDIFSSFAFLPFAMRKQRKKTLDRGPHLNFGLPAFTIVIQWISTYYKLSSLRYSVIAPETLDNH
jgi:hypothetical protein